MLVMIKDLIYLRSCNPALPDLTFPYLTLPYITLPENRLWKRTLLVNGEILKTSMGEFL